MGSDISLAVESESLDLARIGPLLQPGLDIKGSLSSVFLKIQLPKQRMSQAEGEIRIKGKGTQLDPSAFSLPIALPILNLGDLDVQGSISRGQLKFEKFKIGSQGKDLEIQIPNGIIQLSDISLNTRYDLHLLLKPSPTIEKAVPGLSSMLGMWATTKPDGNFAIHVQGTMSSPMPTISKD